jgi:hypothetical protein
MTISRPGPTSQPERTSRAPSALKIAPFSPANSYNRYTTGKPVISKFCENGPLISALIAVLYKKSQNLRTDSMAEARLLDLEYSEPGFPKYFVKHGL